MKKLLKIFSLVTLFVLNAGICGAQVENHCLRLSNGGSVDCGPMPELDGLTNFTVQFWFCADEWTEGATLLSRGEELNVKIGAENKIVITVRGKEITVTNTTLITGKWLPLMILSQPKRVQIYLNNTLVRNVVTYETVPETSNRFIFGGDDFRGRIDEVRIWDTDLAADYEYFTYTTLNKWVPQLSNLVAYFKFDQPWCSNVVDYKPLFSVTAKTNHHGIFSETGASREKVTDNQQGLPYLLMGGYTDHKRFFANGIERDKYLLSNDLIFLGLRPYSDGHVRPFVPNDHATVRNGEYLSSYINKKRSGVLSLSGTNSYLLCPTSVFNPTSEYTLETWIYLEEWTEGGFIFKKENASATKGFSVRLGDEDTHQIIVRIDGRQYFFKTSLTTGRWAHIAITPGDGTNNRYTVFLNINGLTATANTTLSDSSADPMPTGMSSLRLYIGQNLNAKFDETLIWHKTWSAPDIEAHRNGNVPLPGPGKSVAKKLMEEQTNAYYTYNYADNLGFDLHSIDGCAKIMESCYDGYTGYQIRIAVDSQSHPDWKTTISTAERRKIFAADLAELSKPYAGVELDLEWMDGVQTNLGLLADEILAVLPKGKSLMISMHQYGAYQFPKGKINNVDGYTFQQYGPNRKEFYSYNSFVNGYNAFVNYGYPKDKIYLSYGTTTTKGSNGGAIIGYNWGIIDDSYKPATDGSTESGIYKGETYYFCGPVQVYDRAKFVRDNQIMGLFYWDICNDLSPSHRYSLSRNANYALNANVDPRVDEVTIDHPTPIRKIITSASGTSTGSGIYDLSGRRINPSQATRGIFIQNGKKIVR